MAKTIVYTGENDFIVNKLIYVLNNGVPEEKHTTTSAAAAKDIAAICEQQEINEIHLYGPTALMKKLQENIIKRSNKFTNKNINFTINIGLN